MGIQAAFMKVNPFLGYVLVIFIDMNFGLSSEF